MAVREPRPYAVWLLPATFEERRLGELIRELADHAGSCVFDPHATLCSGTCAEPPGVLEARLAELAAALPSVHAGLGGLEGADAYFGFLYARLGLPGSLLERACSLFPGSHAPRVGPHLSLLYADPLGAPSRERLVAQLEPRLPNELRFDRLALVRPLSGSWSDPSRWQTLATRPLGGTEPAAV